MVVGDQLAEQWLLESAHRCMLLVTSVCLLLGLVVVQLGFLVVQRLVLFVVNLQLRDLEALDLWYVGLFLVLMTVQKSLCY